MTRNGIELAALCFFNVVFSKLADSPFSWCAVIAWSFLSGGLLMDYQLRRRT